MRTRCTAHPRTSPSRGGPRPNRWVAARARRSAASSQLHATTSRSTGPAYTAPDSTASPTSHCFAHTSISPPVPVHRGNEFEQALVLPSRPRTAATRAFIAFVGNRFVTAPKQPRFSFANHDQELSKEPEAPDEGPRRRPRHDDRHQGDLGGLHAAVRAAQLPQVVDAGGGHLGAGWHRLPRRLRHRRQHRHRLRHDQRVVGHPHLRRRRHADRIPGGVLLGALQHRPRPGHPRQRVRLLRLGGHQRHLRDVHLHLLRARGLDHGPGPRTRPRHSAVARVCGIDARSSSRW